MLKKYQRIMEWDVPEVEEKETLALILTSDAQCALAEVEARG